MAQALKKVNTSPMLKTVGFLQKWLFFSKIPFQAKPSFLKSPWHKEKQSHTHPQVLAQKNAILLLLEARARYRKKKLKSLRMGRAAAGAHLTKMKAQ